MIKSQIDHNHEEKNKFVKTDILKGWIFRINEISNGYFRVEGFDQFGHSVSRDGIDREQVIKDCQKDILEIFSGL